MATDPFASVLDEATEEMTRKARILLRQARVRRDPDHPNVWWVGSTRDETVRYRVSYFAGYITCSCEHGQRAGGGSSRCYHCVAVGLARKGRL